MDKNSFIKIIDYEDKNVLSNLYDKIKLSEKTQKTVFTNEFFSPNLWKCILELHKRFDTNIYTYGIFEDTDRRMMAFSPYEVKNFPIKLLRVESKSRFDKLKHRDYLGAIMALGIKREKFGDFIVKDNVCYVAVCNDIADYIIYNLNSIGRSSCSVSLPNELPEDIRVNSEDFTIFATSLRVDCVIASICNLSRSKAVDLINSGKVLLDYAEGVEKNSTVKMDSIVTIRGYGKFKVMEELGSTQKGRLKLVIKKYI